jgi:Cu/Ag efflux protein CusF
MKATRAIWASAFICFAGGTALAQQSLTGTVTRIDEQKGTITINQTQGGTVGSAGEAQDFKAGDGLLFNALRPGDKISFTVSDVNGTKTITQLKKQ